MKLLPLLSLLLLAASAAQAADPASPLRPVPADPAPQSAPTLENTDVHTVDTASNNLEAENIDTQDGSENMDVDDDADTDSIVDFPTSMRPKKGRPSRFRRRRFPKFCPCRQVRGRRGKCYFFLKSKGYKCKSRRCVRRYACVSKKFAKKLGKRGKRVTVCIKRTTRRTIVPWVRKGRKGYCKPIKTRKRIFYVPYVRK